MTTNILVVCTGNICRSPMAEALFRVDAGVVGLDVRVASAGSWEGGVPADPHAVAVMADRGIDIGGHRSHVITEADIAAAHLIIGMAREHVVDVAARVPVAFDRTFTLKEFAARALDVGPRAKEADVAAYLGELSIGRRHTDMLRGDQDLDVADPLGQPRRAFERTATELERLVWTSVDLLAGFSPQEH